VTQTVDQILSQATFYSDEVDYVIIKLHPRAITVAAGILAEIGEPFGALIVDKDEVTLLTYAESIEEFEQRLQGHVAGKFIYRLITIDVELEPELLGFMARITSVLAKAGVSVLTYAAFSRDHFCVPAEQFDIAMSALAKMKSGN
jgi:hypothetical protein